MATAPSAHKKLTISDVMGLGRALVDTANLYPTQFLTERDFFPVVVMYLNGRVPGVTAEVAATEGTIDFRLTGPNPIWLELAVQPRALSDSIFQNSRFPATTSRTSSMPAKTEPSSESLRRNRRAVASGVSSQLPAVACTTSPNESGFATQAPVP